MATNAPTHVPNPHGLHVHNGSAVTAVGHIDVSEMVTIIQDTLVDALRRSPCWERMMSNQLPFTGRAAYLEQHWEGLRVLDSACAKVGFTEFRELLSQLKNQLGEVLDRAHATAQWRDHHVTMPSMLEFRRRINELVATRDRAGLAAQAIVRITAASACPSPHADVSQDIPPVTVIYDDEHEELFAEELSAAMMMVLAHGSDVCRAYPADKLSDGCAVTVAAIRAALG